ncbi:MAG: efflux RND transporter periplasmic adaptor subunit [Pseudomonadota bacterium]
MTFILARKHSLTIFAASALAAAVLSGCSSEAAPPAPAHPVLVMTVKSQTVSDARSVPGVVSARYATEIGFQAGGRIGKRLVEVGQVVRKGQALLQLDASDYALALSAAEDQASAAKVDADQAGLDQQRFAALVADGAVSVADNERQKARADAAKARALQAGRQVQLARNRARYATLVAPYDGVVTAIRAEAGQVVGEGQPIVAMARQGEFEISADIPEALVSGLSQQHAQAEVWGTPSEHFALTLRELAPAASQPLRTYRARFSLRDVSPEDRAQLRLGMTAQVTFAGHATASAIRLPASALMQVQGQTTVWVVPAKQSRLLRQTVRVLSYQNDTVTVTGLQDGMQVVIAGTQKLDAKMPVRAVERSGAGLDLSGDLKSNLKSMGARS